jgi:hypothetical protein
VGAPARLRELDPFLFEEVIAELLAGFGWEVNVTPPSRDGGYDILGVTTDPSGLQTSWVVECKRYGPGRKVGVEVARQILGVKTHIGVPNAVLVTTAAFSRDVQDLSSARQDLHLIDFETLADWLGDYSPPSESSHTAERSFASCFISHSSKDDEFAKKLTARLRREGVHVWYAPEDILPGDKIYEQIKRAISAFDRLLVVLSADSMSSNWVQTELASAIAREKRDRMQVLFPIGLVSIDVIRRWECVDADSGIDIARELRSYYIPDFSDWRNEEAFDTQLAKVVKALEGSSPESARSGRLFRFQQRMRSSYPGDRAKAAREIGGLRAVAAPAIPTLRKALRDPSMQVRNAAAWALGEIGTDDARRALKEFEDR